MEYIGPNKDKDDNNRDLIIYNIKANCLLYYFNNIYY